MRTGSLHPSPRPERQSLLRPPQPKIARGSAHRRPAKDARVSPPPRRAIAVHGAAAAPAAVHAMLAPSSRLAPSSGRRRCRPPPPQREAHGGRQYRLSRRGRRRRGSVHQPRCGGAAVRVDLGRDLAWRRLQQLLVAKGADVAGLDRDAADGRTGRHPPPYAVDAAAQLGGEGVPVVRLREEHEEGGVRVHQDLFTADPVKRRCSRLGAACAVPHQDHLEQEGARGVQQVGGGGADPKGLARASGRGWGGGRAGGGRLASGSGWEASTGRASRAQRAWCVCCTL